MSKDNQYSQPKYSLEFKQDVRGGLEKGKPTAIGRSSRHIVKCPLR